MVGALYGGKKYGGSGDYLTVLGLQIRKTRTLGGRHLKRSSTVSDALENSCRDGVLIKKNARATSQVWAPVTSRQTCNTTRLTLMFSRPARIVPFLVCCAASFTAGYSDSSLRTARIFSSSVNQVACIGESTTRMKTPMATTIVISPSMSYTAQILIGSLR